MNPNQFGRYVITSEIGRGGMATVYHAFDPRFERDVAIKVLPQALLHDPQFRARFEREAKTIAMLEHPAIVPVYDFGEEEGQPFIVMRYMSGGSLSDRLDQGALPADQVSQIISRLAPALDAAHAHGIVHRDLKPANVLFDQYGNAFLSDFGIARLAESNSVTLTGDTIVGTPAYMSPEQVQGDKELDGRSDLYALGVIIYQMLTGQMPYRANTPTKLMMMHLLEPVPDLGQLRDDLPPAAGELIARAMAKDPADRYSTTAELALALDAVTRSITNPPQVSSSLSGTQTTRVIKKSQAEPTRVSQKMAAPPPASPPPHTATSRRGVPLWGWIVGGLALLGLLGSLGLGGLVLNLAVGDRATASPAPITGDIPVVALGTPTTRPSETPEPTAIPSPTPPPLPATLTPTSTHTEVPTLTSLPSNTPTPEPLAPVIGGADKIAFVNNREIWAANLDGSELVQLTSDGGEKFNLQWSPDGESIFYIMGKCISQVTLAEGRVDTVVCFNFSEYLDEFEISPDGLNVAISMNHELFIVPFDLAQLAQATSASRLNAIAGCKELAPLQEIYVKTADWSADGSSLAVVFLSNDVKTGKRVDRIDVLDISACRSGRPTRLDQFPTDGRFSMSGYDTNPIIQSFSWDGLYLFALNSFIRNSGFGSLYIYNMDLHKAELRVDPIRGTCCYRDPQWSPDGSHLLFAFQDIGLGEESAIQLYYIPYGAFGTGALYQPIPLPESFFPNRTDKPQAVLRPAH